MNLNYDQSFFIYSLLSKTLNPLQNTKLKMSYNLENTQNWNTEYWKKCTEKKKTDELS